MQIVQGMPKSLKLRRMYNNIMAQAISSSGKHLFAGNRYGDIFVIELQELEKVEEPRNKLQVYPQGKHVQIHCLSFHRDFLIVGTTGVVYGLKWYEELGELNDSRAWQIRLPIDADAIEVPDVNAMWLRQGTDALFVGSGDNLVHQIDLEDGRFVREYRGHKDYIHGVTGNHHGNIYSASEDGTLRLWANNEKNSIGLLEPKNHEQLLRPEFGNWLGAVAVKDDWLICGGGPRLSIWHLGSRSYIREFSYPGKIHVCDFLDDGLYAGGEHKRLQVFELTGTIKADIPVEHTATYSVVWQTKPIKFMSIAGLSNKLHVATDFRFLDCEIELYGNVKGSKKDELNDGNKYKLSNTAGKEKARSDATLRVATDFRFLDFETELYGDVKGSKKDELNDGNKYKLSNKAGREKTRSDAKSSRDPRWRRRTEKYKLSSEYKCNRGSRSSRRK